MRDDYGIDLTVEVFEEHRTTGMTFAVQLKATDTTRRRPRLRLKRETIDYWATLDFPLLVVLYDAAADALYAKWGHSVDLYGVDDSQKSITVSFADSDRWTDNTSARLLAELSVLRALRSGSHVYPLETVVVGPHELKGGFPIGQLRAALIAKTGASGRLFRILPNGGAECPTVTISVTNDETVLSLAGRTATIHHAGLALNDGNIDSFVAQTLLSAGLLLARMGDAPTGARLVSDLATEVDLRSNLDLTLEVLGLLVHTQRFADLIRIAEMVETADPTRQSEATVILTLARVGNVAFYSPSELEAYESYLRRAATSLDPDSSAARTSPSALYSLGNFLRSQRRWSEALEVYRQVPDADRAYEHRSYYHSELASLYFLTGDSVLAVEAYERSLELGNEAARPTLADALLNVGRYEEAAHQFALMREEYERAEWRLKRWVSRFIVDAIGITVQDRRPEASFELVDGFVDAAQEELLDSRTLRSALDADLITPQAWWNVGTFADQVGADAVPYRLCAAVLALSDCAYWIDALSSMLIGTSPLLWAMEDLVQCARRASCAAFDVHLLERLESDGAPEELRSAVAEVLRVIPPEPEEEGIVRVVSTGQDEYVELRVSDLDT